MLALTILNLLLKFVLEKSETSCRKLRRLGGEYIETSARRDFDSPVVFDSTAIVLKVVADNICIRYRKAPVIVVAQYCCV